MVYEVQGQQVGSLKEVGDILGERVSRRDIEPGGKFADMVSLIDADADGLQDTADEHDIDADDVDTMEAHDDTDGGDVEEDTTDDAGEDASEDEGTEGGTEEALTADEVLEVLPKFSKLDELKEFIKDIDTPTLEYFATALGCEWKPTDNAPIHRMRVAQSLHHYFFPELFQPKESKKKGKYGDLTDAQLASLAKQHDVKWIESTHAPINRMRLIMALKAAGHLPG